MEEQLSKKVTLEQETKPKIHLREEFKAATKAQGIKELPGPGEVAGEKRPWNLYFKIIQ